MRVAAMAQRVGVPIVPVPREGPLPTSHLQQRIWLVEQLEPGTAANNLCVACHLHGALSPALLAKALTALVERHEILRTAFEWSGDQLIQTVHPPAPASLRRIHTRSGMPEDNLERLLEQEARKPFDISRHSLLRYGLIRLGKDRWVFLLTAHHLVFDGWSFDVFMRELARFYAAMRGRTTADLSVMPLQFADYASWERQRTKDIAHATTGQSRSSAVAGTPVAACFPSDLAGVGGLVRRSRSQAVTIPTCVVDAVKKLSEQQGVTLFTTLLAAFQVLLHRCSGESDIMIGSPSANRTRPDMAGALGPFVSMLPMRARLQPGLAFQDFLRQVRDTVFDAREHQHQLLDAGEGNSSLHVHVRHALSFETVFAYQNVPRGNGYFADLEMHARNVDCGASAFDVALFLWDDGEGVRGQLQYDRECHSAGWAQRLFDDYLGLLREVSKDAAQSVSVASPATSLLQEPHRNAVSSNVGEATERIGQAGVRPLRVDPAAIEAMLPKLFPDRHAGIARIRSRHGHVSLVACMESRPHSMPLRTSDLQEALSTSLEGYLLPSRILWLTSLPRDTAGGLDRLRLRRLAEAPVTLDQYAPAAVRALADAIAGAFADVLGLQKVSTGQSLFDLGGDSLTAMRVVSAIHCRLSVRLPLAAIFEHESAAGLAWVMAGMATEEARPVELAQALVEIKKGDAPQTLYLVAGGGGGMADMAVYAKLFAHVEDGCRVLGFLPIGDPAPGSVAERASAYVRHMRRSQAEGPYWLGGECIGGLIAYEMARQLREQGQEVSTLMLIDTWCPSAMGAWHYRLRERPAALALAAGNICNAAILDLRSMLRGYRHMAWPTGWRARTMTLRDATLRASRTACAWAWRLLTVGGREPDAADGEPDARSYMAQSLRYRPKPYPGRVDMLVTEMNHADGLCDPWRRLALGGLAEFTIAGDHASYLAYAPRAAARQIDACLSAARGADPLQAGIRTTGP